MSHFALIKIKIKRFLLKYWKPICSSKLKNTFSSSYICLIQLYFRTVWSSIFMHKKLFNFLLCEQFFSEPFGLFGGNISLMKNDENKWVLQKALSKIADVISFYQICRRWFNIKPVQCVALQDRKQISFKIDSQMLKYQSVMFYLTWP